MCPLSPAPISIAVFGESILSMIPVCKIIRILAGIEHVRQGEIAVVAPHILLAYEEHTFYTSIIHKRG